MEKGQLNFNQPLLSVRRGSSTAGQPELNRRKTHNSKPTLPPLPYYKSDLKSGPIRNPGAVPFQWEQMPGRPKDENKVPRDTIPLMPAAPKLPPGRIANHEEKPAGRVWREPPNSSSRSQTGSVNPSVVISHKEKVPLELEESEKRTVDEDISSSDNENVTFVDAPDTLSRSESFYNCSVSGVSGLDVLNTSSPAAFLDPQTRDFMMDRFLPAAKAVASETPPYASRKHSAAREKPKPVMDVIKWKKLSPQYNTLPQNIYGEEPDEDDDDDDDDDDEYDGKHNISAKFCGLLPRFCLLNPIPGMRDHAPAISPARSVRTRPSYVGFGRQSEKKDLANSHRGSPKRELHKHTCIDKPSATGNYGSKSIAPFKDGSPLSFSNAKTRFLDLPLECRDLSASKLDLQKHGSLKYKVLAQEDGQEVIGPPNPAMEKTLYVYSEHVERSRDSISSSSDSRGRDPSVDYSLQDIKFLGATNEKQSQSKRSDSAGSSVLSTSEKSFQDVGEDLVKDLQKHPDFRLVLDVVPLPKTDIKEANQKSSLLLAPLLPKSPSESWLSRTLPSMPSKDASPKPYQGNLDFRSSPMDPRRDRLLRTTYGQHMLFRPAGELAPILEN